MTSIDTIFFDLGNVLFAFDYEHFHRSAHGGKQTDANAEKRLNHLAIELECGRLREADFLHQLLKLYPSLGTTEYALACWSDIFTLIETTIACVRQLQHSGRFHLGVISNTNEPHIRHLRKLSDVLDCFDSLTLSHEIGVMKPDAAIYHAALKQANANPTSSLFFDDRADNVAAAKELGIQAIQVTKPGNVLAALERFCVTTQVSRIQESEFRIDCE
jgi:FMN phosphatase YigB (HAD superfamily)